MSEVPVDPRGGTAAAPVPCSWSFAKLWAQVQVAVEVWYTKGKRRGWRGRTQHWGDPGGWEWPPGRGLLAFRRPGREGPPDCHRGPWKL